MTDVFDKDASRVIEDALHRLLAATLAAARIVDRLIAQCEGRDRMNGS